MTHMCAESAALLPDQLELFHRMWELRLLDMALQELRIEGLIHGPVQAAFGQEAVGIGATATLGAGDIAATTRRAHALHVGLGNALGATIDGMIGPMPARAGGAAQAQLLVEHAYAQSLDGKRGVTLCVIEHSDANTDCFGAGCENGRVAAASHGVSRGGNPLRADLPVSQAGKPRNAGGFGRRQ